MFLSGIRLNHDRQFRSLLASILFIALAFTSPGFAEELEPRRWTHLPINTNFLGAGYAYTNADITFDPVLKIESAELDMHTWLAKYIRTFSLLNKTARFSILQAYQEGKWSGLLDGIATSVRRSGWTDTFVRFAVNLFGAPPLQGKEYVAYRSSQKVETLVGVALSVQLPTGEYMSEKLLNLGTNRFTFRPQLGFVHTRGKWSLETTGTVAIYTDNTDFFNGKKLEQDPLYTINSHLVYTFHPGVWASLSGGYDYGKRSTVDGDIKDDRKENLAWAASFGFPVNRHLGFKLAYIGIRPQRSTGNESDTVAVGLSAFW